MFVCFYSVISLINKPGLTQGHGEAGNTSQGPSGGLDMCSENSFHNSNMETTEGDYL